MKKKVLSTEELRENSYEYGVLGYLQEDLDALREGGRERGGVMGWFLGEVYCSIYIL